VKYKELIDFVIIINVEYKNLVANNCRIYNFFRFAEKRKKYLRLPMSK